MAVTTWEGTIQYGPIEDNWEGTQRVWTVRPGVSYGLSMPPSILLPLLSLLDRAFTYLFLNFSIEAPVNFFDQ